MNRSFLLYLVLAFLSGSLPFSVWIGRLFLRQDIRALADHNPGATNVLRAGGRGSAALALLLDILKGAIPVGLAHLWLQLEGRQLVWVAILPVMGHAYSPFLGFRGGKAVAVTAGIWSGLTIWEGPVVGGIALGSATLFVGANGWAVVAAMTTLLAWLMLTPATWNLRMARPEPLLLFTVWILNMLILIWKHRADLSHLPRVGKQRNRAG